MNSYNEHEFRTRVDAALGRIRTVLENTRNPQYPADVPHRYEDKYLLAEFLTRLSIASTLQCLEVIGLSPKQLVQLREWAKTRSVTIRFAAQEDCRFLREETRKVESPNETVTETRGLLGKITRSEKVVTTVTEYFWAFEFKYEIVAFQGNAPERAVTIYSRSGAIEIKTGAKAIPRPKAVVRPNLDVNVTWLMAQLDAESRATFTIERTEPACHTPRRNRQVDDALRAFGEFGDWCASVDGYFRRELFPAQQDHGRDLASSHASEVFIPVLPLFEGNRAGHPGDDGGDVVPFAYTGAFLEEERRSLTEKCRALSSAFPRDASVITAAEAVLLVTLAHAQQVCQHYASGVAYIEEMLRKQLIAAIGKEVTAADFADYMTYHHRKLVKPEYRPQPFSYAIRRPDHDPEGVVSIEALRGASMSEPIYTTVTRAEAQRAMNFPLGASTRVSFLGDRYLHAWISHQFSGQPGASLELVARARQFSSFILLVGRIASADAFEPRFGIIVQNKDLLKIPLMLEQIPTPKEFRDAIESLSPEQQRFARAFRGMQLESTLFGVCVIQIKPQLEKLLKLPADSLTKEIRLTQELLNLFLEYQLPSDLLSYDGPAEASTGEKLARVKEYVARMQEMITLSKKREIEQEQEREALRRAELNRTAPEPEYTPRPPPMYAAAMPFGAGGPPMPAPAPAPMMSAPSAPRAMAPPAPPGGGPPPPAARPAPAPQAPSAAMPVQQAAPPAPKPTAVTATPTPTPTPTTTSTSTPTRATTSPAERGEGGHAQAGDVVDYTRIPTDLDQKFEALDEDGAVRATIINPGDVWSRKSQKGLLSAPTESTLLADEHEEEKNRAFDLLDALTKSGALALEDASLHVVLAATHRFDRTLLDTVIQQNVNPIEKVERSLMIVGTTIHRRPVAELLADEQRERFFTASPRLDDEARGKDSLRLDEGE